MERYCANCDRSLGLNDQFCPGCGSPAHETARVSTPNVDVSQPGRRSGIFNLAEGVFTGVSLLVILVIYSGFVLSLGSGIAIVVLFVVGALTGSTAVTFAVTGVVLLIYLAIAVLFFIGMIRMFHE